MIAGYADSLPVTPAVALDRFVNACLTEFTAVDALPGSLELLEALPADRFAVVTSGTRVIAEARMRGAGLPAPAFMIAAGDVTQGKPHPMPYLAAAERLGLDPSECLVVEDAPAGLAAGLAAGCRTLALLTTHGREDLDGADLYAKDLSAVEVTVTSTGLRVSAA